MGADVTDRSGRRRSGADGHGAVQGVGRRGRAGDERERPGDRPGHAHACPWRTDVVARSAGWLGDAGPQRSGDLQGGAAPGDHGTRDVPDVAADHDAALDRARRRGARHHAPVPAWTGSRRRSRRRRRAAAGKVIMFPSSRTDEEADMTGALDYLKAELDDPGSAADCSLQPRTLEGPQGARAMLRRTRGDQPGVEQLPGAGEPSARERGGVQGGGDAGRRLGCGAHDRRPDDEHLRARAPVRARSSTPRPR